MNNEIKVTMNDYWEGRSYTYTFDSIDHLIKAQIDSLPRWCKGLEGEFEYHEWTTIYSHGNSLMPSKGIDKQKTIMFPYYLCKHCHAVSSNFTTTPPDAIKRVR